MGVDTNKLGRSASRGALSTVTGQSGRLIVQMAGLVVLARLLDPSDYGLLAMVVAIIGVGDVFRDFGLSMAAVQADNLNTSQRDNLFWINTGLGCFLASACYFSSPLIASVFSEPRLVGLTHLLSLTFILNGIATQYRSSLNRDMKFGRLALVDFSSQLLGLCLAVSLAVAGAGYWALAAQQIMQAGTLVILLLLVGRWIPRRYSRDAPIRPLLRFGANLMATQLLGYASRNVDSIIIGHKFGAGPLGLYNRAYQLLTMPLNQLNAPSTTVALPILVRLKHDRERFNEYAIRGQTVMITVICSIFAFAAAQAPAIVNILFGPQWSGVTPIFRILAFAGMFQAVSYATYWIFLAYGLAGSNFRFSLVSRTLIIAAMIVGSHWGVYGVAAAYTIGLGLLWPFGLWWIAKAADTASLRMGLNGLQTIVMFCAAAGVSILSSHVLSSSDPVISLLVGSLAMAIATFVLACVSSKLRSDIHSVFILLSKVWR